MSLGRPVYAVATVAATGKGGRTATSTRGLDNSVRAQVSTVSATRGVALGKGDGVGTGTPVATSPPAAPAGDVRLFTPSSTAATT